MRLLVTIPNFMRDESDLKMLMRCISSVKRNEPLLAWHIVVLDDASTYFPDTAKAKIEDTGVKLIRFNENHGYSHAVNHAIKFASDNNYDLVLTLNSDAEVTKPFYNRVLGVLRFDEKIAVVGGLCLFPTGKIQSAGFTVDSLGHPILYDRAKYYIHAGHTANKPRYVFGVTGAFQFIRVSSLKDIGTYSYEYEMSYEDVEFCQRAWLKGYKVFYDPHVECIHSESVTRGSHVGPRELRSFEQWERDFSMSKLETVSHLVSDANAVAL